MIYKKINWYIRIFWCDGIKESLNFLNDSSLSGYISWSYKKNWFTYIKFDGIKCKSVALWLLVTKNDDYVFFERINAEENKLIRLRYFEWIIKNRSYVKTWSKKNA